MSEKIILAGGCFWGMQGLIDNYDGVISTTVGYAGGDISYNTYEQVKTGNTGHAEAIEIEFDDSIVNLRKILMLFFQIHNPTTLNRQGNDIGSQYRSVIFYFNDSQKDIAIQAIKDVDEYDFWGDSVVTAVEPFSTYVIAEESHQKYLQKHPNGYTCHFPRSDWKLV